jgi:hypothetical protein
MSQEERQPLVLANVSVSTSIHSDKPRTVDMAKRSKKYSSEAAVVVFGISCTDPEHRRNDVIMRQLYSLGFATCSRTEAYHSSVLSAVPI